MKKGTHILVVSQCFFPEQFRINDICQEWIQRGYEVTVLTGIPNYPQGKFYDGYGFFRKRKENWNGINIIRIPLIPRGRSNIGLICNYFSFVIVGFLWKCFTRIEADYVFNFETSPMTQALIAVWYAKKRRIPCYIYVQDLWPENVEIVTGIHNPAIIRPIEKMVQYIYRNCTMAFATSPSFVKEICKRNIEKSKVLYWPQYAEEFYRPIDRKKNSEIPEDGNFKIVFTGNIGYAQGLDILVETAVLLKERHENVRFYIVGDGRYREEFERKIKTRCIQSEILLIGKYPAERIPEILSACDAAFLSFMDNPLFEKTIPAKLQSYMACGMPIIAAAAGETARIISEAKCGVCSPIGNAEALADCIHEFLRLPQKELQNMKQNSIEYCEKYFNKKMLMDQMERYFNENIEVNKNYV